MTGSDCRSTRYPRRSAGWFRRQTSAPSQRCRGPCHCQRGATDGRHPQCAQCVGMLRFRLLSLKVFYLAATIAWASATRANIIWHVSRMWEIMNAMTTSTPWHCKCGVFFPRLVGVWHFCTKHCNHTRKYYFRILYLKRLVCTIF